MNIPELAKRLELLYDGNVLLFTHGIYGEYKVSMNPQRNRICATPLDERASKYWNVEVVSREDGTCHYSRDAVTEQKIHSMLMFGCGEWFLLPNETYQVCECCEGKGKILEEQDTEKV